MKALSDEEIYKDREFREIRLVRSDENQRIVDFVLDTRNQKKQGDETGQVQSVALFMSRLKQLVSESETVD